MFVSSYLYKTVDMVVIHDRQLKAHSNSVSIFHVRLPFLATVLAKSYILQLSSI